MSDFHIVVIFAHFNDYYTLIVAFLTKQIQNRYRNRRVATPLRSKSIITELDLFNLWQLLIQTCYNEEKSTQNLLVL